ncbi:MAG: hypothetical protein DWQ19_12105 [Crenarchaeota archaeon]|nr:MAG: hypothetical protein DWQ19_12105 [Thermoproteota archaeon]
MNTKKTIAALLVLICVVGFFFVCQKRNVSDFYEETIVLDCHYKRVVLQLAQRDTLEEIVALNGGQVLAKNWNELDLDFKYTDHLLWNAEGSAWFVVEANDPHLDKDKLEFIQRIHATQNKMTIKTELLRPVGKLQERTTTLHLSKFGNKTRLTIRSRLSVSQRCPKEWQHCVQEIVTDTNRQSTKNTAAYIKKLTESLVFQK